MYSLIILVHTISFPILLRLCSTKPLSLLISAQHATDSGFGDWVQEVQPQNGFVLFNTAQKFQFGAFKSMWEGKINPVRPYPFQWISSTTLIALMQLYKINSSHLDLSSSVVPTLSISLDEQIKNLAADALSIQWATTLLQDVYNFIALYHQSHYITCPVAIPQFWFVKSGLMITKVPGVALDDKEADLIEELIQSEEGPWRKYINNNHSHHHFLSWSQTPALWSVSSFLPACAVLENWLPSFYYGFSRWACFWLVNHACLTTSPGGDTLLVNPQIITHPCKIFSATLSHPIWFHSQWSWAQVVQ